MIKYFCDNCSDEITDKNKFYMKDFELKFAEIVFNIDHHNQIPAHGAICKYCIIDAVNDIDDREFEEQPRSTL